MARELTHWDPIAEADSLHSELDRLFDRLAFRPNRSPHTWFEADWTPAMDVEETDSSIIVRTELPGMKKDDIKVSGSKDSLCISGERRFDEEELQAGRASVWQVPALRIAPRRRRLG